MGLLFGGNTFFRSLDGGETFQVLSNGLGEGQCLSAIAIKPDQPTTVFAVHGFAVFRSRNRGDSWEPVNPPLADPDLFALALHPIETSTLLTGSFAEGVFISTDEGENWELMPGSPLQIWSFALDPVNPNLTYVGAIPTGVWGSTDGGQTWETRNSGLFDRPIPTVTPVADRPTRVFAGSIREGVFRSDDSGSSWERSNDGLSALDVQMLRSDRSGEILLSAARRALAVSQDGADSWNTHFRLH